MPYIAPQTLTETEQQLILRATAGHARDHLIFSLALGTGLRLAEVVGWSAGDVSARTARPGSASVSGRRSRRADMFLPDLLVAKAKRFWRWKRERGEDLTPSGPLFCAQSRKRISKKRVQFAWLTWQKKAGFDRLHPVRAIRDTAVSNVYRASRDLLLAQRFARHVSPLTTTIYTHPGDNELRALLRVLHC